MLDAGIIILTLPISKILPGTGFWHNSTKTTFCQPFLIIQKKSCETNLLGTGPVAEKYFQVESDGCWSVILFFPISDNYSSLIVFKDKT